MWDNDELNGLEFIPEPSDPRILSAVDSSTIGHQEGWRGEVIGWDPTPVRVISRPSSKSRKIANTGILLIVIMVIWVIWRSQVLFIEIPPERSEWAFEDTGARDLQDAGLSGNGVRVCMVDTGIDISHPDFDDADVEFKDFISGTDGPTEYGKSSHGTMMAGILIADGYLVGVAPGVTLGMAAALDDNGEGRNTGDENSVANAIQWCWETFDADIISLSLGGVSDPDADRNGPTANAVRLALANGVYVVAAAGNDGGDGDDGRVATPSDVPLAISVAALDQDGDVWSGSSLGSSNGGDTNDPNLKPEISAPGVDIISTATDGEYYTSTGTSDATVFVTGILALILEAEPQLKDNPSLECIEDVKTALMNSATPLETGESHNAKWGYGAINGQNWLDEIRATGLCLD